MSAIVDSQKILEEGGNTADGDATTTAAYVLVIASPDGAIMNTQLKQFYKLKQANRGNNEQIIFAANTLLASLATYQQRTGTGKPA